MGPKVVNLSDARDKRNASGPGRGLSSPGYQKRNPTEIFQKDLPKLEELRTRLTQLLNLKTTRDTPDNIFPDEGFLEYIWEQNSIVMSLSLDGINSDDPEKWTLEVEQYEEGDVVDVQFNLTFVEEIFELDLQRAVKAFKYLVEIADY